MRPLRDYLRKKGLEAICIELPTTFDTVANCAEQLGRQIKKDVLETCKPSFVGHSMGGLVVMELLAQNSIPRLGRCILIATPIRGSKLAALACRLFDRTPLLPFSALQSLRVDRTHLALAVARKYPDTELGIIAGNKCNLILGRLLAPENDGRIEVASTKWEAAKESVVLPYGHHEIHHKRLTAELVYHFLETGSFRGERD
jgi:pimeloyl-ACP methyl ester carboxylesterase